MTVFGRKRGEEAGNILFQGNYDQCQEFISQLDKTELEELNIDEDNGIIKERIL